MPDPDNTTGAGAPIIQAPAEYFNQTTAVMTAMATSFTLANALQSVRSLMGKT